MIRPPVHHAPGRPFTPPHRDPPASRPSPASAPATPSAALADVTRAVELARAAAAERAARPSTPAPDPGTVLAALPRADGTELRVSVHVYEGRPFVRVAPWQRGSDGAWWPVKGKGATVRTRELPTVIVALAAALDAPRPSTPPAQ